MALDYFPLAEGQEFTKEMLDATFKTIASYTHGIDKHFAHLEGHIAELAKRPPVTIRIPKNSKLFLVAFCATSVYVGYKLRDRAVQQKLKEIKQDLKREFETRLSDENMQNPDTDVPKTDRVQTEN